MKPYTVIFFIDGDYAVEHFVERVWASSPGAAFDNALVEAQEKYSHVPSHSWRDATEVATFAGHVENATD